MAKFVITIEDIPPTASGETVNVYCDQVIERLSDAQTMTNARRVSEFIELTLVKFLHDQQTPENRPEAARCCH